MSLILGDYIDFISGPAFKSNKFTDSVEDVPLVKGDNLAQGYIKWEQSKYWPAQEVEAYTKYYLCPGDIVLAMDRPWVTAGLKFARIKESDPLSLVVQRIARLRATNGMSQDFLHAVIGSKNFEEYIKNIMGGTNVPHISPAQIRAYEFEVDKSSFAEIGSIYKSYTDLIENNRRRIQLLEESARLLYQEWFVHLRFPGHEQVKITGGVPEGWSKEPLENLLILQRGFDLPLSNRIEGNVPIYASTGINGVHNVAKVKAPGVVTGRSGSLGTVMYVAKDFWPLNTTLWVKEFKKVSPIFATFLLRTMKLEGYNGGAAVPTLNRNDVHKVDVLCPTKKLMSEFELQVEDVFKQVDKLKEYNDKLAQARDLLLPKLMSGELAV